MNNIRTRETIKLAEELLDVLYIDIANCAKRASYFSQPKVVEKNAELQRSFDDIQIKLLNNYMPKMDSETATRAVRTIKYLEGRI